MILHKLTRSPFTDSSIQLCLERMSPDDGILLALDAVYALSPNHGLYAQLQQHDNVFVMQDDLLARGLGESDVAQCIGYERFVALSLHYLNVISW